MTATRNRGRHLIIFSWAGLAIWQLCWHALLPEPMGNANWILAVVAFTPLLLLSPGVMKTQRTALSWGMFLVMMYFIVAVMEAWSNPPQRTMAVIQLILTCCYFLGLVLTNRPSQASPD